MDGVLLVVAFVWGSSYLASKVAVESTPVLLVLFLRYAISAGACLILVQLRPGRRSYSRAEVRAGAILGCTQAGVLILETYGVAHTSAANAGLIISLTIVATPLISSSHQSTRLPGSFLLAALVCVLGVGCLVSSTGLSAPRLGDGLMLLAAVVRAVHVTLVGRLTIGRDVRPLHLTTVQSLVGTFIFGLTASRQLRHLGHVDSRTWTAVIYLAVCCSVFAFVAQTWAVQRTSPARASLLLGTEPVWAVAVGLCLGGEHLTAIGALGAALVVGGSYRGQSVERAHREAATPCARRPAARPGRHSFASRGAVRRIL
jgi:drug/metabolite transporter (DMT)-like permease